MVEVECPGVQGQDRFWGRRGGRRWVVGLSGWRNGVSGLCCRNEVGLVGGRRGRIEAGSFAALRMTVRGRGCEVGSGCLWGAGWS